MIQKINFLFLVLISTLAYAGGGSVVRNGGGLGEMSAVMVFQKMDRYLSSCLQNNGTCRLTDQDVMNIKKVVINWPTEFKSYQLQFFSSASGPDMVTGNFVGSPITLRSGALADSSGVPYSFSQIGSLVLSGLLAHHGINSLSLAEKVFRPFKSVDTSLFVNSDSDMIHWIQIEANGKTDAFDEVILEQANKSFDLFPIIQSEVKLCADPKSLKLRIQRMISANPMAKTVILDVNWNCGSENDGTAKIELELSFSNSGAFDLRSSRASAFSVLRP